MCSAKLQTIQFYAAWYAHILFHMTTDHIIDYVPRKRPSLRVYEFNYMWQNMMPAQQTIIWLFAFHKFQHRLAIILEFGIGSEAFVYEENVPNIEGVELTVIHYLFVTLEMGFCKAYEFHTWHWDTVFSIRAMLLPALPRKLRISQTLQSSHCSKPTTYISTTRSIEKIYVT